MKATNRSIVVFYCSQTGTAEDFASRLAKQAKLYGVSAMSVDPEECEMEDLDRLGEIDKSVAFFCAATYGEGEPTDNATRFFDWLRDEASPGSLANLNYAVFGLGNKTYERFNAAGIFLDSRLAELGARRLHPLGLGDDDSNIEDDFNSWQEAMWPSVCSYLGISAESQDTIIRQYRLAEVEADLPAGKIFTGEMSRLGSYIKQRPSFDVKNPFLAAVVDIRELHSGGDRSCLHIELDISDSRLRYECGDHLAVYPTIDPELVQRLCQRLGVASTTVFCLDNIDEESSKRHPFPCPCSLQTAFSHYLDIVTPPKSNVLRELARYASNEDQQNQLKLMSSFSDEGKILYGEWVLQSRRSIVDVLEDMDSVAIEFDVLCELLGRLQPRYYSISSSPKMHPNRVHITAAVLDYQSVIGRRVRGIATGWFQSLHRRFQQQEPLRVPIFIRRSQFKLPYKNTFPVIMVGPGTGLAPFRGFIQDRAVIKREGRDVGEMILYFGCRRATEDFIYREELESLQKEGVLSQLHSAFSRDTEQKVYVQHLIRLPENAQKLFALLESGAYFYICGDAKNMARDLMTTIEQIICDQGGMSLEAAQNYIKKLQNKNRFSMDIWS